MMTKLKKYDANMKAKMPEPMEPVSSGIACTEKNCDGEMMVQMPIEKHPQLPLKRAVCSKCGWRGWV